jgi:hypothetical protein
VTQEPAYSQDEALEWLERVAAITACVLKDEDAPLVREAAANLTSEFGLHVHLPATVADVVYAAIEAGYADALQELRRGGLDDLVAERAQLIGFHPE